MTAREFLSQPYKLNRILSLRLTALESRREKSPCRTIDFSGLPKASSRDHSKVEETALKLVEAETEIRALQAKLELSRKQVYEAIRKVGDIESETILELRYLAYLDWSTIGDKVGYSLSTLFRKHREALQLFRVPIES